jgi:lysozyme family protein
MADNNNNGGFFWVVFGLGAVFFGSTFFRKPSNGGSVATSDDSGSGDAEFEKAASYICKKWESDFIPDDNGSGNSKFGLVQKNYPDLDIKNMSLKTAKKILYTDYWLKIRAPEIPKYIRVLYLDAAVNQGQPTAVRMLQKSTKIYKTAVDGKIGPQTIEHARKLYDDNNSLYIYAEERMQRYDDIVKANSKNKKFYQGWKNRVADIVKFQESLL